MVSRASVSLWKWEKAAKSSTRFSSPVHNNDEDSLGPNSMRVPSLALRGRKGKHTSKRKPCNNCSIPALKQVLRVLLYP